MPSITSFKELNDPEPKICWWTDCGKDAEVLDSSGWYWCKYHFANTIEPLQDNLMNIIYGDTTLLNSCEDLHKT